MSYSVGMLTAKTRLQELRAKRRGLAFSVRQVIDSVKDLKMMGVRMPELNHERLVLANALEVLMTESLDSPHDKKVKHAQEEAAAIMADPEKEKKLAEELGEDYIEFYGMK